MIYQYNFNQESNCSYIPIHMNVIHHSNLSTMSKLKLCYVTKDMVDLLCHEIRNSTKKVFILDFFKIESSEGVGVLSSLDDLFRTSDKIILLINLVSKVFNQIYKTECSGSVVPIGEKILTSNDGKDYYYKLIKDGYPLERIVDKFKTDLIATFIKDGTVQKEVYLNSSNVYANKYIDIKKTFQKKECFFLIIYQLCIMIENEFKYQQLGDIDIDYLVCSSNNGAIIASLLGQLLGIKVVYLMNLGPNLTVNDKELIKSIDPKKKYLYIYDFICLGTEYRITKSLLLYKDCRFLGAAGVALFTNPIRDIDKQEFTENILSIFNVSDTSYGFDYEVYCVSKELEEDKSCQ